MSTIAGIGTGVPLTNAGAPVNGTSEIQHLTFGGTITGGTFTLTFDGYTTADISWTSTDATLVSNIQTALNALPNLEDGEVTVADSTLSSGIGIATLTFGGNRAKLNVSTITCEDADLTGTSPTAIVTVDTAGVDATHREAALGAVLIDTTNRNVYVNRGSTLLNPDWELYAVGDQQSHIADLSGVDLTWSANDPGGTPDGAITIADGDAISNAEIAELFEEFEQFSNDTETKLNAILVALETFGITATS